MHFVRENHFLHHEKYGIAMPFRTALGGDDGWLLFLTLFVTIT